MTEISMWDTSSDEVAAEQTRRTSALATAAVEPLWPFLSAAASMGEFEHRLSLQQDNLGRAVAAVAPTADPMLAVSVAAGLRERFAQGQMARSAQQRFEASLRAAVAAEGDGASKDATASKMAENFGSPWAANAPAPRVPGYSPTGEIVNSACDTCGTAVPFEVYQTNNGPFTTMEAVDPAAGSDNMSIWCPAHRPARHASKTASTYCPNHGVYVGEGNQEQHDHCTTEQRKSKDAAAVGTGPDANWRVGQPIKHRYQPGDRVLFTNWNGATQEGKITADPSPYHPNEAFVDFDWGGTLSVGPGESSPVHRNSVTPLGTTASHRTASWTEHARAIVEGNGYRNIDPVTNKQVGDKSGVILDQFTASMLVQILDALSPDKAAQFAAMPIEKAVDIGWKLVSKTSAKQADREDEGFFDHTPDGGWCPQCTGTGKVDEQGLAANADGPVVCPSCGGAGARTSSRRTAAQTCPSCRQDTAEWTPVMDGRKDDEGETLKVLYCSNCDYGVGDIETEDTLHMASRKTAAGPIRWTGDTHMGVSFIVGLADNGNVYECYYNPNMNPTPCAWAQYGPRGDTGLNSQQARQGGFTTMQDAMKAAEAHASQHVASAGPAVTALLQAEAAYMGPADAEGYVTQFGSLKDFPCIVRTTNGGETGPVRVNTQGSTYPMDVLWPDGHWSGLTGGRVVSIKPLEQSKTAAEHRRSTCANCGSQIETESNWDDEAEIWVHTESDGRECENGFADVAEPSSFLASKQAANPNFRTPDHCMCPSPPDSLHWEIRDDYSFVSGPYNRRHGGPGSADYALMKEGDWRGQGSTPNGPGLHLVEVDPGNDGRATANNWDSLMETYRPARPASVTVVGSKQATLSVCADCEGDAKGCEGCGGKGVKTASAKEDFPVGTKVDGTAKNYGGGTTDPDFGGTPGGNPDISSTRTVSGEVVGHTSDRVQIRTDDGKTMYLPAKDLRKKMSAVQALLDAEAAFFHAPQAPNRAPAHMMPAVEPSTTVAPAPRREPETEEPEPIVERPRQAVRKAAEAIDERLDGLTQNDDLGQGGSQPLTTRPRVMPGGGGDAVVSPAATPVAKNPEAAPVDPLRPTVGQKVQARVARLARRIREDNPTLSTHEARALAIRTVQTYPEMVSTGSEA